MSALRAPVGTLAFLFTDIEGSTKRWESHQDVMGEVVARHDALLRREIEVREGYVFKTVGDAFCAAFPTASLAVSAALAIQHGLATLDWGEPGPIRVRMAVHVGAAEKREEDRAGGLCLLLPPRLTRTVFSTAMIGAFSKTLWTPDR